jgi:hypothetical protein
MFPMGFLAILIIIAMALKQNNFNAMAMFKE